MGPGSHKVAKQSFAGKERSQAGAWEREKGARCAHYMTVTFLNVDEKGLLSYLFLFQDWQALSY